MYLRGRERGNSLASQRRAGAACPPWRAVNTCTQQNSSRDIFVPIIRYIHVQVSLKCQISDTLAH